MDRTHLERPGNLVVDDNGGLPELHRLARAGQKHGNHLWMQINHTGRQTERRFNAAPLAPSEVPLKSSGDFARPRAMQPAQIIDVSRRFAYVAKVAKDMGFSGVQIHAAHGYLLSQFLSPLSNQRNDDWGGALENRSRLLLDVVRLTRDAVGDGFPVGVKLNSSDFQAGGFSLEDSSQVAKWLAEEGVDLIELSGGSYERLSMTGIDTPESTLKREAHFLDFAHAVRSSTSAPIMVTGGFRTRKAMIAALDSKDTDIVGIAAPFCVEPDLAKKLLTDDGTQAWLDNDQLARIFSTAPSADMLIPSRSGAYHQTQMFNLARFGKPSLSASFADVIHDFIASEAEMAERLVGIAKLTSV